MHDETTRKEPAMAVITRAMRVNTPIEDESEGQANYSSDDVVRP